MNRFIAFDCHDGEEKALQIDLLAKSLIENGYSVVVSKEATATDLGLRLSQIIASESVDVTSQAALQIALRNHHMRTVVEPALARGAWVICDRFSGSYEVLESQLDSDGSPCRVPDITFYIHLDASTILSREGDDEGKKVEKILSIDDVQKAYAKYADENHQRFAVLDGSDPDEVVFTAIQDRILLGGREPLRVALYDMKSFRKLEEETRNGSEYAVRITSVVRKISDVGGKYRNLAVLPPNIGAVMDEFDALFPNFSEYSIFVRRHFALARLGDGRLALPPVLFVGDPGIGKTEVVDWLSGRLGNGGVTLDMASMQAGASIVGSDAFWANSKEGMVFEALAYGETANPFFVLEEIDKAGQHQQYDPLAPFYLLLERKTASCFRDMSVRNFPIDASHVQWVATANDRHTLPEPILKRFTVFEIPRPTPDQTSKIAGNIYRKLTSENSWGGFFEPELNAHVLERFAQLCLVPREMVGVIKEALGRAAEDERPSIQISDLNIAGRERQPMGFIGAGNSSQFPGVPVRKGPMPR